MSHGKHGLSARKLSAAELTRISAGGNTDAQHAIIPPGLGIHRGHPARRLPRLRCNNNRLGRGSDSELLQMGLLVSSSSVGNGPGMR